MRRPSPYSLELLAKLLLTAGFLPKHLVAFLVAQDLQAIAFQLPLDPAPLNAMSNALEKLSGFGVLDAELLGALEQQPELAGRTRDFKRVRIEMELDPPPDALVSEKELEKLVLAARQGKLHEGLGFAQLRNALPLDLRRRAARALDDGEQLAAWFDAANRQVVGPGDAVRMVQLLEAAIAKAQEPGRTALETGLERLRLTSLGSDPRDLAGPLAGTLEAIVEEQGIQLDAGTFHERMGRSLSRVCLVRVGDADKGTGFLVGDDLVLTNYHVLHSVLSEGKSPGGVRFLFDYRTVGGMPDENGPQACLATAGASEADPKPWLIDALPMTPGEKDGLVRPLDEEISTEYLDFALVRIDQAMGTEAGPGGEVRGHFVMAHAGPPFPFAKGTTLIIIGHPHSEDVKTKSAPQVFAIEPDSVIGRNANRTRVRYRTNTLKGSSGSPVLSAAWELVALHHFGMWHQWNQGIPMTAITARKRVQAVLGI